MKKKIALISINTNQLKTLKKLFKNVEFRSVNSTENLEKYNAIISFSHDIIHDFIINKNFNDYPKLEWIHMSIAGVEDYTNYIKQTKILFTCGKIIQGSNVSDHAMAMLLYLTRLNTDLNGNYYSSPIILKNKKVLIYGSGGIGLNIAQKCFSFGCEIYSVSNSLKPDYIFIKKNYVNLDFINDLSKFDIIFVATPLTSFTENFFNYKTMNKFKNGAYLINISRGKIVNTEDLIILIKKNKFSGVGLDVLDKEPVPRNHPLKKYKNVLLTNHSAGLGSDKKERFNLILNNIEKYINNKKLNNIVSRQYEY